MVSTIEYPREWYRFVSSEFGLTPYSLTHASQFRQRKSARLIEQVWEAQYTQRPEVGPGRWQGKGAFFSRLDGDTRLIRIGDPLRCIPLLNRSTKRAGGVVSEPFSDGTYFTDATGWVEGPVPEFAYISEVARRGDKAVVIAGLGVSYASPYLNAGDLFEIRPNGIPSLFGMLYEVVVPTGTDAQGRGGVEIRPRLRANIVPGDQVVFHHPRTVMRLIDSRQGRISREANVGAFGFACVEETP